MALQPLTYVLLAGLVVLPAVALVQHWRDRLYRWRLSMATSVWLITLATLVPELTESGPLSADFALWPALTVASALAGMAGMALTVWFWRQRDRPSRGPVGA